MFWVFAVCVVMVFVEASIHLYVLRLIMLASITSFSSILFARPFMDFFEESLCNQWGCNVVHRMDLLS